MATVTVSTANFIGPGGITCRRCNKKVDFTDSQQLVMLSTEKTVRVFSALDLTTAHACGRELYFWCPNCEQEVHTPIKRGYRRGGRRAGTRWHCGLCDVPVRQRERRS